MTPTSGSSHDPQGRRIGDALFRQAEHLARRQQKSRSRLYAEAISEYLRRRDPDEVTAAIDSALDTLEPSGKPDAFLTASVRRALRRFPW